MTFPGGAPGTAGAVTPLAGPTQQSDGSWVETWTETIDSAAAGAFNVQASDAVTMGGVAVTRTTGDDFSSGDGGDSSSAVKNYVDANISITPLTPVNEVGNAETFTVTETAFPAGTGAELRRARRHGQRRPDPDRQRPDRQRHVATWTVTIDSDAAGTFNVQASDTVTMGGVAVTRTTGDGFSSGDGSDSPSAVKNYVDALIAITPLTPVNEVGNAETFTVTATAFPAGAGPPSFGALGVTVSGGLTPTVSGPSVSGDVATWTVTIDIAAAGTFNVTASDTVTMGGVAVTRTTGDGFSSDDGATAPRRSRTTSTPSSASPLTPVNAVNHAETFTVTATAFPAGPVAELRWPRTSPAARRQRWAGRPCHGPSGSRLLAEPGRRPSTAMRPEPSTSRPATR